MGTEIAEKPQCDSDCRIKMPSGYSRSEVNTECDTQSPDNTDLPQTETGGSQFHRCEATDTKKQKESGAQKFGKALLL